MSGLIDPEPSGLMDALFVLAECVSGSGYQGLLAFQKDQVPVVAWASAMQRQAEGDHDWYLNGAYLVDPFYQMSMKTTKARFDTLREIAPRGFASSEYHAMFFKRYGLTDEVSYLVPVDAKTCLHFSIDSSHRPFSTNTLENLRAHLPVVKRCLEIYWRNVRAPVGVAPRGNDKHETFLAGFEHFGSSILTRREQEVVKLLLRGYATAEAAETLGISPQTLVVHRRSIYKKLSIRSQSQLFVLFLNSLLAAEDDRFLDPLEVYQAQRKGAARGLPPPLGQPPSTDSRSCRIRTR